MLRFLGPNPAGASAYVLALCTVIQASGGPFTVREVKHMCKLGTAKIK